MTNFAKSVLYISFCIAIGTSCKEETFTEMDYSASYGSWVLGEASKNGKATRTLEGTTFDIDSSTIVTNLFGEEQKYKYKRDGNRMQMVEHSGQLFTVRKSTSDSLVLSMKRKRTLFQLTMVKEADFAK